MALRTLRRTRTLAHSSMRGMWERKVENDPSGDTATENWDSLFRAIMERLRLTVGDAAAVVPDSERRDPLRKVRADVLDCVSALGQVYEVLTHDLAEWDRSVGPHSIARIEERFHDPQDDLSAVKDHQYHALHDRLTLLPNGEYFRMRVERALGCDGPPCQALAVMYVSLNLDCVDPPIHAGGFHTIQELLKAAAARLSSGVRAEDMLGRLQGDRFACLVPGLSSRGQLSTFANQLLAALSVPLNVGISQVCVHPSLGIAIHPANGTTSESLLTNAEFAMYRAKRKDTGYAFVDE